jgi:hypothetical protein
LARRHAVKIESLHLGMKVLHPHYGTGVVKAISENRAEIDFEGGRRTVSPEESHLEPAEPFAVISGMEIPLATLIDDVVRAAAKALETERQKEVGDSVVDELGSRWHGGRVVLHPADPSLQPKEVPLENFFHKIVMMRNNLRVLEQKINGHEKLTDGEKVEMEQYISRCYGSMTTFNILFARREDQFSSKT